MDEIQSQLVEQLKKFGKNTIEPTAQSDDQSKNFRIEYFNQLGELGYTGMTTGESYGGLGLNYQTFCLALEELAKTSVSYAVTVSVSSMVQGIIEKFATESQKKQFLPSLASGEEIGAFALSESGSGSDAASLKTTAKKNGKKYILNGSKLWITSGGVAKTYIVMARTGEEGAKGISAFIVRDGTKGFSYGKNEDKMGWRASPTRELFFNNCEISEDQLLWEEGKGFNIAMTALDMGRVSIGAIAVGLSVRALDEATTYSLSRKQFNQNIFNFQGLQFMLADMATEIECSRLLVYEAARKYDLDMYDQKISSMAKLKATDTAMKVTTDAVQILGGVGYTSEYPVERLMRDAKVLQIVEGTNQIQKVVIARNLKNEYSKN